MQVVPIGVSHRMQQEVEFPKALDRSGNYGPNLLIVLDIERNEEFRCRVAVDRFFDATAVLLLVIVRPIWEMGKAALASAIHDFLGNRPGNRTIIGDPEDQTLFSSKHPHENHSPNGSWQRIMANDIWIVRERHLDCP